jgi:hypothetical protein
LEIRALYKPTGQEIQMLLDKFGKYAEAGEALFRDAIRLIRDFIKSDY